MSEARKHMDCSTGDCLVGSKDECPHYYKGMTLKAIPCPECKGALDTIELRKGRGVTKSGIFVEENGAWEQGTEITYVEDQSNETIGVCCSSCDWSLERSDWPEFLQNYEANEIARLREELLAIKEGREPPKPPETPEPTKEQYIVLLHDDDLSGSLDPEKSNADDLRVFGPFDSMAEAADWINETGEDVTWLCQVHRVAATHEHTGGKKP